MTTKKYVIQIATGQYRPIKSSFYKLPHLMEINELNEDKIFKFIENEWDIYKY